MQLFGFENSECSLCPAGIELLIPQSAPLSDGGQGVTLEGLFANEEKQVHQ